MLTLSPILSIMVWETGLALLFLLPPLCTPATTSAEDAGHEDNRGQYHHSDVHEGGQAMRTTAAKMIILMSMKVVLLRKALMNFVNVRAIASHFHRLQVHEEPGLQGHREECGDVERHGDGADEQGLEEAQFAK
ncbi:unnamed protein product [Polarella glacialis]|uniref:Secreted protein n=1 Tax=Polarella glacialis TaxID=89957 RepID=A0A813GW87_POLGL|nr:unnamed protein product [Polarella glacialis]CAE8664061.1 unnamed protein product [Polarella glacialis]